MSMTQNEELSDKWQRCLVSADSLAAEVTSLGVMCREKVRVVVYHLVEVLTTV